MQQNGDVSELTLKLFLIIVAAFEVFANIGWHFFCHYMVLSQEV
jgi:hypothetical protein